MDNENIIANINKLINDMFKDRRDFEIIIEYKEIKSLVYKLILDIAKYYQINDVYMQNYIQYILNQIRIKNMSFDDLEMLYNKIFLSKIEKLNKFETKDLDEDKENYDYDKHNINDKKELTKKDIFPKKTVKVIINGIEVDLEVFDSGYEYIPVDEYVSEDVKRQLSELKEKERINNIADMMEQGNAGIYLDPETNRKVVEELNRRQRKNLDTLPHELIHADLISRNSNREIEEPKFYNTEIPSTDNYREIEEPKFHDTEISSTYGDDYDESDFDDDYSDELRGRSR